MSKVLTDQIEKRTGGTAMDLPATGKWPTANIADDAIGANQLATNSVVSASIVDGAIVDADINASADIAGTKLADNAVTLAKMAGLARGSIIVGDASGDPSALTKGSANQVLKSDGTDVAWGADSGGLFSSYALCSDQVSQNTVGQGITTGAWRVRNINTEIADPDGIVSLSSNRFSLAAGSYAIKAFITAYHGNAQLVRLYDYTNSAVAVYGQTTYLDAVHNFTQTLVVMARVTPSGTTEYEIQHRLASTIGQLPAAASNYGTEGYLFLEIYKEA